LKSDNIFLSSNGLVKIVDFGFSKPTNTSVIESKIGTPTYFSHEIIQEKPYMFEVDCWAFGCILYKLISLNKVFPFPEKELNYKIVNEEPEALFG
jgi:serine/threonine protein kinase